MKTLIFLPALLLAFAVSSASAQEFRGPLGPQPGYGPGNDRGDGHYGRPGYGPGYGGDRGDGRPGYGPGYGGDRGDGRPGYGPGYGGDRGDGRPGYGPGYGGNPGYGPGYGGNPGYGPGYGGNPGYGPGYGGNPGYGPGNGGNPGYGPGNGGNPGHGGGGYPQPVPQPAPGPQGYNAVYRFVGVAGHFQTLNFQEGVNAGFRYEGVSFNVLARQVPGSVPLFRCVVRGTVYHFTSNDGNCEGQQNEGAYGFVLQRPGREASRPIYRCVNGFDHLTTATPQECAAAGYRVENSQGFVQ